ncbi:MAG: PQQ-binding-like beta-propeller repeat protein [Solirubrobacterales bacterium]|nr:PQQ-binding-like beta-propeller repeat protein [Solirubrobacterales bacterium]
MWQRTRRAGLVVAAALALVACGTTGVPESSGGAAPGTGSTPGSPTASAVAGPVPGGDWVNFDADAARSGIGPSDTGITAANVGSLRARRVTLDGIADSAAVEVHGVRALGSRRDLVVVTTSYGRAIAVDAQTGRLVWQFMPAGIDGAPGNPQVTTAGPVVDPDRRFVYSAAPNGTVSKLALATGRPVWTRAITLDPAHEKLASALNVAGGSVVVQTGGYIGDIPPYDGHLVTIDRTSGRIVHVFNSECSNRHRLIRAASCRVTDTRGDDAMWGRAGAVIEPGSGRILTATGNGPFDGSTNWGNSALELSPDASRLLHNWTPTNWRTLDSGDVDVGSASPAVLPPFHGRRLAVQGGKDGRLHVLDLTRLDGTTAGAGKRLGGELSETSTPGGAQLLTAPAVWSRGGRIDVFVGTDGGTAAYELVDPGHPRLRVLWHRSTAATSPVLAGGLLYLYDEIDGSLVVRQPLTGALVRAFPVAPGHWNSPIVVGGRVILPTGSYHDSSRTSTLVILHLPGR